jgi:hypothetical protein
MVFRTFVVAVLLVGCSAGHHAARPPETAPAKRLPKTAPASPPRSEAASAAAARKPELRAPRQDPPRVSDADRGAQKLPLLENWFDRLSSQRSSAKAATHNRYEWRPTPGRLQFDGDRGVTLRLTPPESTDSECFRSTDANADGTYFSCLYALFDRQRLARDYVAEADGSDQIRLAAKSRRLGCQRGIVKFRHDGLTVLSAAANGDVLQITVDPLRASAQIPLLRCKK